MERQNKDSERVSEREVAAKLFYGYKIYKCISTFSVHERVVWTRLAGGGGCDTGSTTRLRSAIIQVIIQVLAHYIIGHICGSSSNVLIIISISIILINSFVVSKGPTNRRVASLIIIVIVDVPIYLRLICKI